MSDRSLLNHDPKDEENGAREKNWPPFHPILRHNIQEDIPQNFKLVMRIMLGHCFLTLILLLFNLGVSIGAVCTNYRWYVQVLFYVNVAMASFWLAFWGFFSVFFYFELYKSISTRRFKCFKVFFYGTICEILLCGAGVAGFPGGGFMGFVMSIFADYNWYIFIMGLIISVLFSVKILFLITMLIIIRVKFSKFRKGFIIDVAKNNEVDPQVGNVKSLPLEIGTSGRRIKYLPANASLECKSKVEKLITLPNNSFTIISDWRKVDASLDESYILYVENEPGRAYWSNAYVAEIINGGLVNPMTQVITISRLPNGSFAFGVADKE